MGACVVIHSSTMTFMVLVSIFLSAAVWYSIMCSSKMCINCVYNCGSGLLPVLVEVIFGGDNF